MLRDLKDTVQMDSIARRPANKQLCTSQNTLLAYLRPNPDTTFHVQSLLTPFSIGLCFDRSTLIRFRCLTGKERV